MKYLLRLITVLVLFLSSCDGEKTNEQLTNKLLDKARKELKGDLSHGELKHLYGEIYSQRESNIVFMYELTAQINALKDSKKDSDFEKKRSFERDVNNLTVKNSDLNKLLHTIEKSLPKEIAEEVKKHAEEVKMESTIKKASIVAKVGSRNAPTVIATSVITVLSILISLVILTTGFLFWKKKQKNASKPKKSEVSDFQLILEKAQLWFKKRNEEIKTLWFNFWKKRRENKALKALEEEARRKRKMEEKALEEAARFAPEEEPEVVVEAETPEPPVAEEEEPEVVVEAETPEPLVPPPSPGPAPKKPVPPKPPKGPGVFTRLGNWWQEKRVAFKNWRESPSKSEGKWSSRLFWIALILAILFSVWYFQDELCEGWDKAREKWVEWRESEDEELIDEREQEEEKIAPPQDPIDTTPVIMPPPTENQKETPVRNKNTRKKKREQDTPKKFKVPTRVPGYTPEKSSRSSDRGYYPPGTNKNVKELTHEVD